jgi:23S rRNA pseudouridine955/2504/2580 synthase
MPGMTNTEIFKLIRKEIIKVNNKKTDSNYILKENDKVSFFLADVHFENKGRRIQDKFQSVSSKIDVIFENDDVIVVNKPAGLLIHPDKKEFKNVLSEMIKSYLYKKGEYKPNNYFSPSPCHRLDSNTSGLVVFAKNQQSLHNITGEFRERESIKTYLALFFGKISGNTLLTSFIDASENKENKVKVENFKIFTMIPEKKDFLEENKTLSATLIKPLKWSGTSTLAEIDLWTGKKHQIRCHLQANSTPLLGDNKYFTAQALSMSQMYGIKNYFLHCYKLKLEGYNEWIAPVPLDFKKIVLETMKIEI